MTWVRRTTEPVHRCMQPEHAGSVGDLWRCDGCGKLWRIAVACLGCRAGWDKLCEVTANRWKSASPWQRWRWRRRNR